MWMKNRKRVKQNKRSSAAVNNYRVKSESFDVKTAVERSMGAKL